MCCLKVSSMAQLDHSHGTLQRVHTIILMYSEVVSLRKMLCEIYLKNICGAKQLITFPIYMILTFFNNVNDEIVLHTRIRTLRTYISLHIFLKNVFDISRDKRHE